MKTIAESTRENCPPVMPELVSGDQIEFWDGKIGTVIRVYPDNGREYYVRINPGHTRSITKSGFYFDYRLECSLNVKTVYRT